MLRLASMAELPLVHCPCLAPECLLLGMPGRPSTHLSYSELHAPPLFALGPRLAAGQVLELAVFLSIKQGDEVAFERNFAQLRVYYGDARPLLPPSDQEATLTALNLLRLLVQNRIAEFHTELEVVPPAVQAAGEVAQVRRRRGDAQKWERRQQGSRRCVPAAAMRGGLWAHGCACCAPPRAGAQVVELEQWLMEGAYNKVLDARARAASDYYKHFLDQLSSTVRWGWARAEPGTA